MSKAPRTIAQDGLTSANLQVGLDRVPAAGQTFQKGLTSANLQAALTNPPAPPPAPAPCEKGASGNSSTSK